MHKFVFYDSDLKFKSFSLNHNTQCTSMSRKKSDQTILTDIKNPTQDYSF